MIFVLVTTSLGAGVLTLPYVNAQNGIVVGSFNLIFGAFVSYVSMRLIMWASYETNIVDYAELVEHCFGKNVGIFLNCLFIFYLFGVLVSY